MNNINSKVIVCDLNNKQRSNPCITPLDLINMNDIVQISPEAPALGPWSSSPLIVNRDSFTP